MLLGVDTGGTFTDFFLYDGRQARIHKLLSTPTAPEQAILQGIRDLGLDDTAMRLVHGSTVATNAVLEGKGVATVYITNRGLKDVLSIGRQARALLYDLQPPLPLPPVPEDCCLETGGRLAADAGVVEELTGADLATLRVRLSELAPRAVAINLLFSYLDDRFERAVEACVPEGVFVSRSSAVLPEYREYERGIATWLNAWVGPLVQGYLERLQRALPRARVSVMQSSGDTVSADYAAAHSVRLLLSGPAGGLSGARHVAGADGEERLLTFDMGGTSTDVALVDRQVTLTSEGRIAGFPVAVPMVDMHTIGAGGGSIARLDAGGMLLVGPQSAGADPGPACYGRGGREATVTDAQLVLGRLRGDAFLGGAMALDEAAARAALRPIADAMGVAVEQAAEGILTVADAQLAQALRVMSVERGLDPADFTLVSFGGAGALHVCALAEALGMRRALVPVHAGVLSALGMLVAGPGREYSHTIARPLDGLDEADIEQAFAALMQDGRRALEAEGVGGEHISLEPAVDVRYAGQSFSLTLPWRGRSHCEADFHAAHRRRYGHALSQPVELINLRCAVRGPGFALPLKAATGGTEPSPSPVPLYGLREVAHLYERKALPVSWSGRGPLIITETVSTTYVAPGWRCVVSASGNLRLERDADR